VKKAKGTVEGPKSRTIKDASKSKVTKPKTKSSRQRTDPKANEKRIVHLRSGGVCAFPDCGIDLIEPGAESSDSAFIGDLAHIVADSRQGPRGLSQLSDEERDCHTNLILLCKNCHKKIDDQPHIYSVSVLRQMKLDHEEKIRLATKPEEIPPVVPLKREAILSSLLPVTHLPDAVFQANCPYTDRQEKLVKELIKYPTDPKEYVRFLIREKSLHTFHDLRQSDGPFSDVIDMETVSKIQSRKFWESAEGHRRFITLLNRAMYKHTSTKGIRFDPVHFRYYFPVEEAGVKREQRYRPLNKSTDSRNVAWQPITKSTGEGKNYWVHLAASLRFHRMANNQWCLSIRPERHLTIDGEVPLSSEKIGRKVTRIKANMFNDKYLSEVNFWRDVLSDSQPRFELNFGSQSLVISTDFIQFDVEWPGINNDKIDFANQFYENDLFTISEAAIMSGEPLDWDEDDDDFEYDSDPV
jgi:hypothetical protein